MLVSSRQRTIIVSIFLSFILALGIIFFGWQEAIAAPLSESQETLGAWEILPLPKEKRMQSVHTIMLPNGKVLIVNGSSFRSTLTQEDGVNKIIEGVDVTNYDVINNTSLLDPETKTFEPINSPDAIQYNQTNDLFCSGHLQLADGNILFVGGTGRYYPGGGFTGSKQINIYNWQTGEWTKAGQMNQGRWYPTLVSLADGKIVIFSGLKIDAPNQISPSLEIYDPQTQKLTYIDLRTIKNSPFNTKITGTDTYDSIDLYPRVFPLKDGRLFLTGDEAGIAAVLVPHSSKKSYFMTINQDAVTGKLSVSFEVGPDRGETSKAYGTAIQVPNSENVLLLGGIIGTNSIAFGKGGNTSGFPGAKISTSLQHWIPSQESSEKIGKWEILPDFLDKPRANLQAVILPTKEILVINGGEYPEYKPVYQPLLMTPNASAPGGYEKKSLAPATLPRLYHNGALLLPDARVLVIGGNANRAAREADGTVRVDTLPDSKGFYQIPTLTDQSGQLKQFDIEEYYNNPQSYFVPGDPEPFVPAEIWQAEIFSPPYLFEPGSRPEITNAPETLSYDQTATISVKDATEKGSLVLIKLGAVTHSFDFGQRLAELTINSITLGDESTIDFNVAVNSNLYPPGYYMMFYLNDIGKPSHAKFIKLETKQT
ncbi:galactose oxidase early set domain-containing protein [Gloeothece verrucosa]|uniref:Uncharacterized protein n=1 Tax=Gloeothece verrucosa (strain PCC 7822) TaxID=497965 RepID=E0UKN3_GLOV7|nr:galactose oxidase early set domain-containing protein [Gloeothece verrucosa]ADN17513.1 Domain of unknown function DUF1929 [Gloeothece verrucosa PCC 7822]